MKLIRKYVSIEYLFALLLFLNSQPFYVWNCHIQTYLLFVVMFCFFLRSKKDMLKKDNMVSTFVFLIVILYLCLSDEALGRIISYFSLFFIFFLSKEIQYSVFGKLKNIISVFLFFSIVLFVLAAIGVPVPYVTIPPLQAHKDILYRAYPTFVTIDGFLPFFRFHACYDEPGALGSICAALLVSDQYDLKKKSNVVIFIAGVLSVSFFFIVSSTIYYLFKSVLYFNKKVIAAFVMLIPVVLISYTLIKDSELVEPYIKDREQFDEGSFWGDNRSDASLEKAYKTIMNSDDRWLGMGADYSAKLIDNASSYKMLLIDYGVLWLVFFLVFWALHYNSLTNDKRKVVLAFLFLLMFIYQRPQIMTPFFFLLFMVLPLSKTDINDVKYGNYKVN